MGKLKTFRILFDNPQGVFSAGQSVSGSVVLELEKPVKMRGISLLYFGQAKSHWEVRKGDSTVHYSAKEAYLDHMAFLFGERVVAGVVDLDVDDESADAGPTAYYKEAGHHHNFCRVHQREMAIDIFLGGGKMLHPAGYQVYPFSLNLSPNFPSSYEGNRGHIRYYCKVTIDKPWAFNESIKQIFTVIRHLDLIREPRIFEPLSVQKTESVYTCCCCNRGTISIQLQINKRGFVSGELMDYSIMIDNSSSTEILAFEIKLKQFVTYTGVSNALFSSGHPKSHVKKTDLTLMRCQDRLAAHKIHESRSALRLPALPPSRLDGCAIIHIEYMLELAVSSEWTSLECDMSITIGTIPARQVYESKVITVQPSAPSFDDLPPSYEECIYGSVNVRDEDDDEYTTMDQNWVPSYPYYNCSYASEPSQPPHYNQP